MPSPSEAQEQQQTHRGSTAAARRRVEVIDAFVDLVLETGTPPTPEALSERAGVSRATLFRYFSTLVELRNDAAARVVERFPELFVLPTNDDGDGSLDDRVRRFVDARLRLHETLHPLELLSRSTAVHDPETSGFVDAVRHLHAEQVREHFAEDLGGRTPARRDDIVAAICVVTAVESWQQFRRSYDRSVEQTRRAWRDTLVDVLTER